MLAEGRLELWETEVQIAVVSSSGVWRETEGVGSYSERGDEIVSFGSLKDMMKLHSRGNMQEPSGIWVKSATFHTGFY